MSSSTTLRLPYLKGHGTGNDFVVIADLDEQIDLTPAAVKAICDRHLGIGADGVLRVIRQGAHFFMDYRNADGSIAETCGNGLRVFARYLIEHSLESHGTFAVGTRAGIVQITVDQDDTQFDNVAVRMGLAQSPQNEREPQVTTDCGSWTAAARFIPNPHCVAVVDDMFSVGGLHDCPTVSPHEIFPDGANFEFVEERGTHHIGMRTYERGVGETQACGSGACAAADVWAHRNNLGDVWTVQVDVLGGTVCVDSDADRVLTLRGPARFVSTGELSVTF